MHIYRLENATQDKEFVSGSQVTCRAIMEGNKPGLTPGDPILIELSKGKKYKGKVVEFRSFPVDNFFAGDLVIMKV